MALPNTAPSEEAGATPAAELPGQLPRTSAHDVVMFAVSDLDDTLARLQKHGAHVVDEVVQFENVYRLCYVRGPESILIGLAERIG